jgi:hypothetical protein
MRLYRFLTRVQAGARLCSSSSYDTFTSARDISLKDVAGNTDGRFCRQTRSCRYHEAKIHLRQLCSGLNVESQLAGE